MKTLDDFFNDETMPSPRSEYEIYKGGQFSKSDFNNSIGFQSKPLFEEASKELNKFIVLKDGHGSFHYHKLTNWIRLLVDEKYFETKIRFDMHVKILENHDGDLRHGTLLANDCYLFSISQKEPFRLEYCRMSEIILNNKLAKEFTDFLNHPTKKAFEFDKECEKIKKWFIIKYT